MLKQSEGNPLKKHIITSAICLTLLAGCGQEEKTEVNTETKPAVLGSGITIANMDTSTRPQDDFYQYVNGTWLNNTEIPSDKSTYGSFIILRDQSRDNVNTIIEEMSALSDVEQGSDAQKIRDLYLSYMDIKKLNELGASPLTSELEKIDAISNYDEVALYFAETEILGISAPFGFFVNNDSKDPVNYIVYLTQSGLGLPDREYYLADNEKSAQLRIDYKNHIMAMLNLADFKNADEMATSVLDVETEIAKIHWKREDRRDRDKTYNKIETAKLSELMANFNWDAYLSHAGIISSENIVVREKSYFEALDNLFTKISIDEWKSYLKWSLIRGKANILGDTFENERFAFYGKRLRGTPQQEERWKRGVDSVNGLLGHLVGKVYVQKHFKPEAKQRMSELVENLREAYKQSIIDLEWMSENTKKQALEKLAKFTPKIGYPDKWQDYSALEIIPGDLFGNYQRAALYNHNRQINKLGKPIDKTEWGMTPQTVNAYYNSVNNEIVFPAAILQPPFFNMSADDAVNYGGIGAVIGHEMGHGFDDQGSKSDGDGVLRNWWTEKDLEEFKMRTGQLVEQYNHFEALPEEFVNGQLTLGENIGDLGGMTVAHKAYMLSLNGKESPVLDGFTGEERFFMGWAQVWAYKFRDEALKLRLKTDPHSPAPFRTNGTLMNMPEFMKVYDVKQGDKMYRKPEERVKIW